MVAEKPKGGKGPKPLAARPFVDRREEEGKYILCLDLNQVGYPFKPEEISMTTKENFLMVRAVHLHAIEGTRNTPTRSEDAGKTWTQEFELPPHTSGMLASCLITQDNLALVTFEHQEDQRQEEKEYEDQVKETAEEEDAGKDRKEKWEVLGAQRGRAWQRRKLA